MTLLKLLAMLAVTIVITGTLFFAVVGLVFIYATKYETGNTVTTSCDEINIRHNAYTGTDDVVCETQLDYLGQKATVTRYR